VGNWEILAYVAGNYFPLSMVGKAMRHPDGEALIRFIRERNGSVQIDQADGIMACLRELRQKRFLSTLPDQSLGKLAGCFVPWFGHAAWTPIGPGALAVLTRTPVLPTYMMRHGRAWHMHCGKMLLADQSAPRDIAAARLMAAITAEQEKILRRAPHQWAWWHMRWRFTFALKPDSLTVRPDGSVRPTQELLDEESGP
jgi:lauroyl/myristoyl acyltransferase